MPDGPVECRVRLAGDDFVLANHRVHGVRVLPGVTLLDLVWRVLAAQGAELGRAALRDVLFAEAVTVKEGCERELRVTVDGGAVRVESRWLRGGEELAGWRENARGTLVTCDEPLPALDAATVGGERSEDMERLYERTRREEIVHGAPMRCRGTLSFGPGGCVADLALEDPRTEDGFHLHPAKMDAATLVAFGQGDAGLDGRGFIPFFVERFRAPRPLGARFRVWVPRVETLAASGDLVRNDFTLHDEEGACLAEVRGMACKRIRHPELITRLVEEASPPPAGDDPVTRRLREEIGALLGVEADDVPTDVGFYDLGLDSVAVLRLTESLEELVGEPLYPTLLFEFGDVASAAEHLAGRVPAGAPSSAPRAPAAQPPDPPAAPEVTLCRTDVWVPVPAPEPAAPATVVVIGDAGLLAGDLRARGVRTVASPEEDAAYVLAAGGGPAALRELVAELVERRPRRPVDVIVLGLSPSAPEREALGAMAATVAAEVPALRCRAVAVDDESAAADAVLRELAAGDGEPHVRYRAGRREVPRWVPAPLDAGDGPGFRPGGRYLIAGAGGIATAVAEHLLRAHSARVLMVSRGAPSVPEGALHVRADLARRDEVEAAVAEARRLLGGLDGVLHCAGEARDAVCFRTTPQDLEAVCAAKVGGTVNLDEATRGEALDLFVLFSSLSAARPNPGQSAYAYANAFQYFHARSRSGPGRSIAVAWPLWESGGMRPPEAATRAAREATGMTPLPAAAALDVLERAVRASEPAFAVVHGEAGRVEDVLPAPPDAPPAPAPIAVVGLAGQYPDAPDAGSFWSVLAEGRDCIAEVPPDRWDGEDGGTRRWGGFLDGVDRFDPAFFGISRRDAERMDPQERLFLTTSWRALEDAGHPPATLAGQPVGVFAGVMWSHYQLHADPEDGVAPTAIHSAVPNRVSYTFDLTGPSLAVDTACSASLTALHLAVESLRRGECTMAVAGGVNVSVHPQKYRQLAQGGFLSDDGRCRSFGEGGTGYVPGEGVGAVVLKPLDRARADGDHVYGVIAATAVNHSGRTSGFTVPSPQAQAALISAALERAGWDPASVGYVEAHGTGTSLGDPIEIEGLRRALAGAGAACAIGSVKSNVGHLESAAGIAGLTKVLLQLHHRRIAPSLHSDRLNPHLELEGTGLRVQQQLAPWPEPAVGGPRRAGLSAFGAGGANAHVVIEEAPPQPQPAEPAGGPHLFVLSARDEPTLREYARRWVEALGERDDALADLARTSRARTAMATRLAVVAASVPELRATLERYANGAPGGGGGVWGGIPPPTLPRADGPEGAAAGPLDDVAAAWVAGADVDWAAAGPPARRLPLLPPYPFRQERCWIGRWRREQAREAEPPAAAGEPVELRVLDPGIALVTMRGDAASNMFTPALMRGLQAAFDQVAARDDVRAVVLAGGERVFSMGATPDALETLAAGGSRFTDAPFVYEGLLRCEVPVVAAIQGHASGGGLVFGLYADIVVMSRESLYSANFVKYGFTPGMGATYILEHRLGAAVANEMLYTGRPLSGEELERRGASVSFAAPADVLPTALTLARSAAEKPAEAVRILKGDLAARVLEQLGGVVERESSMHERVFGPESATRIREHFEKVDGFAAAANGHDPAPPAATNGREPAPSSARDVIEAALCAALYVDRAELDPALSFSEMGLDSIGAVELVREVNRAFDLDLDSVAVYDHPTIPSLAEHVAAHVARDRELTGAATAPAPPPPASDPPQPPPGKVALRPLRARPARPSEPANEPHADDRPEPIAVVGMAGRFPDAPDLAAFWRNLAAGRDSVREVPPERWDVGTFFDPDRSAPDRTYSKWAALLADVDAFDAPLFRISPLEAEAMDPQQRLFLQTAWEGLEDAGYAVAERRRWGVFAGCASGEYADVLREAGEAASAQSFLGNSGSVLAARIAYLLDLSGPAVAIDTACSSSLVAVHLACESLRSGECDGAVAGGVALMLTPRMHVLTSKTGMLSPTGRCAPFDASADGIVLGEGCGVVVLKRLDRALADGDHVHGVIAGSGVNGDGRTNGLTAPSAASQAALLTRVRERAGLAKEDVTYVEAHGTGTPLGDPIEAKALEEALGAGPPGSCGIGSVKGNVGHTTLAAGIAGLLKVLLALRHGALPPTINFAAANPEIDFAASRLRPVTALEPWRPGPSGRLVAGVSSFGFSGTNAHALVAEPPAVPAPADAGGRFAVPVSALDAAALESTRARLADALAAAEPAPPLRDVAYTLAVGRTHFAVRAACVAETVDELVEQLRTATAPPAGDDEPARLAAAYVEGEDVDWRAAWAGREARRVPLPGYAPSGRRYAPKPPQPEPAGWLLAEHAVAGAPTLPGVAVFELAARAARRQPPLRLASVQWLRPVGDAAPPVALEEGERGTRFSLAGAGGVAARGRIEEVTGSEEQVDVGAVVDRCPRRVGGAELYAAFADAGLAYGPSFRAVRHVLVGDGEALARVEIPAERAAELPGRPLHPVPLDAALQSIAALASAAGDGRPRVPFALGAAELLGPVPASGYAHATRDGDAFTVRLTDDGGHVRAVLRDVALRPLGTPVDGMLFVPAWREAPPAPPPTDDPRRVLVLEGPGTAELARALADRHAADGAEAVTVAWPDRPGWEAPVAEPDLVYFLASGAERGAPDRTAEAAVVALHRAVRAIAGRELTLKVATGPGPAAATLPGFARAASAERPGWRSVCVELGDPAAAPAETAEVLRREPAGEPLVRLRAGRRLVRALAPAPPAPAAAPPAVRRGGTYLVVGGAGGIGAELCRRLVRDFDASVAIVGRRAEDDGIRRQLEELGARAAYLRADAADPAALRAALAAARERFGPIHGAFHAALVLRDRAVARMEEDDLRAVLAPKVAGAVALGEALCDQPLDFLVFFSSAASFVDAAGQANYAAASTFEDAYAAQLRERCAFPVAVVNWSWWGSVGAVADPRYAERFAALGVASIEPDEGLAALLEAMRRRLPQVVVAKGSAEGLARLGVAKAAAARPAARGAAPAEAAAAGDDLARSRAAFRGLERHARALLAAELARRGALEPGAPVDPAALRARLNPMKTTERLFAAVVEMLERAADDGPSEPVADPDLAPHVELLDRCVRALPGVLDGTARPTEVLFPRGDTGLVERVYRGHPAADFHHRLLADEMARAVRGGAARVVEVGAGTGSSSAFLLEACARCDPPPSYAYTDLSPAFVRRGEDAFAARFPFASFSVLDVERDPEEQGIEAHAADVVVATNVLHATRRLDRTLASVRRLLRPGGVLLVNEVTRPSDFVTLTFGLTPGWWGYEDGDARLPNAPLLSAALWRRALEAAGFGPVRVAGVDGVAEDDLEQCVIVASAPATLDGDAARRYVRGVFAEVLRFDEAQLGDRTPFEELGVDSIVGLDLVARLEADLGPLPSTLLFEHPTIERLAAHLAPLLRTPEPPASPSPAVAARTPAPRDEDVAVVGVVGRYPGAPDLDAFWQLLASGGCSVTEVPPDRWDWRRQPTKERWGGFLDQIDMFDASFFGILPRDADDVDPQERLVLEASWELLERAGHLGEHTHEPSTGVFVGSMYGSYGQLAATQWAQGRLAGAHSAAWSIANRVSYVLDLRGPSFAVDSACSSSLLAVHLACESIRRGECAMAIAAGVNVILHPAHLAALSARKMLAADGRCKTFDARADGMVPGEGVGAVLLKPLGRALADGDDVWGVLRGGAANAGGRTGGYTVPSPDAQAELVADAVRRAGVEPSSIGYVEAHGTGTSLGDPIELASLGRALPDGCWVGSVKANVGHLEGAAGIAGLTKVLLQLRHGRIAPCAGLEEVNPKIGASALRLPRELTEWRGAPRRAGVSSFGAGGANVHVVVEEPPPAPVAARLPAGRDELFVLSARTPASLRTLAARVADFLAADPQVPLPELSWSSQLGRRELAERLAIVARTTAELAQRLRAFAEGADGRGGAAPADTGGDWPTVQPATASADTGAEAPAVLRGTASPRADRAVPAELLDRARLADLARAWVDGGRADWRVLWRGERPRRIAFPPSPFERRRHWLREPATCRYERPVWEPAATPPPPPFPRVARVLGGGPLAAQVREALEREGTRCDGERPELLVHVAQDGGVAELVALVESVGGELRDGDGPLRAVFVHVGDDPAHVAAGGALRTLALESTRFSGTRLQLDAPDAAHVLAELACDEPEVRLVGRERLVKRLAPFDPPPPADVVRPHATYLIAGGAGGLGRRFAEWLASSGPVDVVLAGRSPAPPDGLEALARGGATVRYRQADVTREEDVAALARELIDAPRPLRGVIHAAGVVRDALAVRKSRDDVEAVWAPKARGAELLDAATAGADLDFFALFSSLAGEAGNPGQVDYAAASAFLFAFAEHREDLRRRGERRGRTVAFAWPLWSEGGMSVDPATERLFRRRGMAPLDTDAGIEAFRRGLASDEPVVAVLAGASAPDAATPPDPRRASDRATAPHPAPHPTAPEPEHLREAVEHELRRLASGFLLVDASHVDLDDDLIETGFDSVSLTELINEVNDAYSLDLLPTVLFECSTLRSFAGHLVERHPAEVAPARPAPRPDPPRTSDVAIVGMAGILPGSPDLAAFWRHLVAGDDLIRTAPPDRAELHADPATAGVRAGFVDGIGEFAAEHFGISPAEAALMDPQQRLFLEVAWRAIEDSGHRAGDLAGTDTGLFVGVSTTDYADLLGANGNGTKAHAATGIAHAVLANRVSHVLDLRGPSEAIDTACSGSLVAIHRAVRAIAAGDCSAAIAGGVNALLSPGLFRAFAESGMLSDGGACRTFDAAADGYVRGEGAGAVLLKPLASALADGDEVHAVIRGSAVNHGGHAASLTAPNPAAQADVLVKAHREAGVDPATVTAIEAHGTATTLGDPVEVEGMKAAFARLYDERGLAPPGKPHVAIGSVKTNVGHLEAAAGIAGVLKMLLALRHGVLPPTIHFAEVNPHVRLAGTPFFVNDAPRPWPGVPDEDGRPVRRAGVSSFGFGGTNAHVVLERHAEVEGEAAAPRPGPHLLVLSAADEPALRRYRDRVAAHLREHDDADLARVAWTLQVGRAAMPERLALVAADRREAIALLEGDERLVAHGDLADPATRWVRGEDVRFEDLWPGEPPRRVSLPGAPLPRRAYWFDDRGKAEPPRAEPPRRRRKVALAPLAPNGDARHADDRAERNGDARHGNDRAAPNAHAPHTGDRPAPPNGRPRPLNGDAVATVRAHVADILGLDAAEVPDGRPFADLGLDSIFRRDLARRLHAAVGVELEARDLYDHDTVERLARHLAKLTAGNAAGANGSAAPATGVRELVERAIGRPLDPGRTFADNGLTSFDMLRAISALERRFGALRKTLLFDRPTLAALEEELAAPAAPTQPPAAEDPAAPDAPPSRTAPTRLAAPATAPTTPAAAIVRKRELDAFPDLAAALAAVDARHAKEGGLAGRDIAPFAFVAPDRGAYLSFSRRGDDVFAWSYAGSARQFPELAGAWLDFARAHGLRPTFLSMAALDHACGVPLTATPFGAVQRLEDLSAFTLAGRRMNRLRYMVQRFEREGDPRIEEYRPGADPQVDAEIDDVIARWSAHKTMVNPYVAVVRRELAAGILAERHRLFVTRLGDRLANVVIVTRIPSENGYLLDLEFYPEDAPLGGLEFAIVRIVERLRDEGAETFSFGASFGVSVAESPNASPEVEQALEELRSSGLIGDGNFQFKSKFRPAVHPIYVCQPADGEATTPLADVVLMIADPDPTADVPGALQPPSTATADDLVTDSWAERDDPGIAIRERDLRERAAHTGEAGDLGAPGWLPHGTIVPTASGRAAEALLCRCWPGARGTVVHNDLFPTWKLNLADAGFDARAVATAGGDVDLDALDEALTSVEPAFVCVELGANAAGGLPIAVENLRAVRAIADRHGTALVLDATRALDSATATALADGRDAWEVARELLGLADAITMSLSKDFGVSFGGLVATRLPALAERLSEHVAMRGHEVGLAGRRLLAAALADTAGVAAGVAARVDATAALWAPLHQAGLPVGAAPGGHCVLLDATAVPRLAGRPDPVAACLRELEERAGVRAAPHLGGGGRVRLAVPVGMPQAHAGRIGERIAALWPAGARVPDDVAAALREGHRPQDDNAGVLREHGGAVHREVVRLDGARVEAFTAGDGPPLILMHPFNVGAGAFARQFAALAAGHRVVCVHQPGVGATTWHDDLTLEGIAAMLHRVLDELGIGGPYHVAGASFGGLVAQAFALAHRADTASLTLVGSSYKVGNRRGEVNRLAVVAEEDFAALVAHAPEREADAAPLQELLLRCESMDPQIGLTYLDVFAGEPDLLARLPAVDVPALVVQGALDTVIPVKTAHLVHGTLPRARYAEIPGAGHFPFLTHADELHALLVPFLAAHEPAVGAAP